MTDDHGADHPMSGGRRMATDPALLARLGELIDVPTPPEATWRAATITLFATDPADITSVHLHHVQDLDWLVPERALFELAIHLLRHRVRDTPP